MSKSDCLESVEANVCQTANLPWCLQPVDSGEQSLAPSACYPHKQQRQCQENHLLAHGSLCYSFPILDTSGFQAHVSKLGIKSESCLPVAFSTEWLRLGVGPGKKFPLLQVFLGPIKEVSPQEATVQRISWLLPSIDGVFQASKTQESLCRVNREPCCPVWWGYMMHMLSFFVTSELMQSSR